MAATLFMDLRRRNADWERLRECGVGFLPHQCRRRPEVAPLNSRAAMVDAACGRGGRGSKAELRKRAMDVKTFHTSRLPSRLEELHKQDPRRARAPSKRGVRRMRRVRRKAAWQDVKLNR